MKQDQKILFTGRKLTKYKEEYFLLTIPSEIVRKFKLTDKNLADIIIRDEKSIMVIFK